MKQKVESKVEEKWRTKLKKNWKNEKESWIKSWKKVGNLKKVENSVKTRGVLNERAATLMDRETERGHHTASQKLHKQNYTSRLQAWKGSHGHIRPAPWQHARHSPGPPHACHRWRRLGFSRQLAHGRHHTCTILDCYNPTSWKIAKS